MQGCSTVSASDQPFFYMNVRKTGESEAITKAISPTGSKRMYITSLTLMKETYTYRG